jgi:hypothetical protein
MTEIVGIVAGTLASASVLVGAVAWMMKSIMQPLKHTIEKNNTALDANAVMLTDHGKMLVDHHVRIAQIETVHTTKGC